jgi:extracellular elastinolytic metalloproteinase
MSRKTPLLNGARRGAFLALLGLLALGTFGVHAVQPAERPARNFDARIEVNESLGPVQALRFNSGLNALRVEIPALQVTHHPDLGTVRSVYNRAGYLTASANLEQTSPREIALDWVRSNFGVLGLAQGDVADFEVRDEVYNPATGATHLYLRQKIGGLPVYNGQLHLNINRDGRLISVNNAFVPTGGSAPLKAASVPTVSAAEAVAIAARHLGLDIAAPAVLDGPQGLAQQTDLDPTGLSLETIEAHLMMLPVRRGDTRLVWNFQILTLDQQHGYDFTVDAGDGQVWTRFDWVADDDYRVYPVPVESPNHTAPAPPADGRVSVVDPADTGASPLAWHDTGATNYTIHRGNNVHAYDDADRNGAPPGVQPDCGVTLSCDFPIDLTQQPDTYTSAAVANLFYWNNILHDVQYQYGFDEAGGNFQVNNFGNGGLGGDDVRAEAQDGGGFNNANFFTPPDGSRPRMQMFLWTLTNPRVDGDFDNGIIVHEYGHGISNRQVGGPGNSSCLGNLQQMGEGWSDWLSLVYTAEIGDAGTDVRGIGTYALGQPPTGSGIRTQPYSTDTAFSNYVYSDIGSGLSVPHGVGTVWAQILWKAYWALVDQHGFDADLYNAGGGAGNQRALLYVNEGFKNTACGPTFLDGRDGILQAAMDNYGGEDVCLLWQTFAANGMGVDALAAGPNSLQVLDGFGVPPECEPCQPAPIADAGPDRVICTGASTWIGTPTLPDRSYSWQPGGQTDAQITVAPLVDTTYTLTVDTELCGDRSDAVTLFTDDGQNPGLADDFESGAAGWTTSGLWHLADPSVCAAPGPATPATAFYFGQDATCNYATGATAIGALTSPVILGITADSTLSFNYWRHVEFFPFFPYDVTRVEVLGPGGFPTTIFEQSSIDFSLQTWLNSGPISLADFAGQPIQIQFVFDSLDNFFNAQVGWFIDDVVITGESDCDRDGDGFPNPLDACPDSDLSPAVVIDGCDPGVANTLLDDGCTLNDLVAQCAADPGNHGDFVSCVAHFTNELKGEGILSGSQTGAIQSCAAQANIP